MPLAVREVRLEFGSGERADAWVAANIPTGMVTGPIKWQLVLHRPGSTVVNLVQGFADLPAAGDWSLTVLPDADVAQTMTVALAEGQAYVAGNPSDHQGPGRVWLVPTEFPGTSDP